MSDFTLLKEDPHAFYMKHPDGSEFHIAKAGLDAKVMARIKKMQAPVKMYDGGITEDPTASPVSPSPQSQENALLSDINAAPVRPEYNAFLSRYQNDPATANGGFAGSPKTRAGQDLAEYDRLTSSDPKSLSNSDLSHMREMQGLVGAPGMSPLSATSAQNPMKVPDTGLAPMNSMGLQKPQLAGYVPGDGAPPSQLSQMGPPAPKTGYEGLPSIYADAFAGQGRAIDAMQGAATTQAKATEGAYNNYVKQQNDLTNQYKEQYSALQKQHDELYKDVSSGKIDPTRVWHNATTGGKIMAGIGILLSGIGSGLTGGKQGNMAMDVINKTIDHDIEAQKEDLNNKHSLLANNMQQYGNIRAAEAATRLQLNASLQAQIGAAAGKAGTKQAAAQAELMRSQLKMQQGSLQMQLAQYQVNSKLFGTGGSEGGIPENQVPTYLAADPKFQERAVSANGRVYQARDQKAAESLRLMQSKVGPVMDLVHQLDELGPSAAMKGSASYEKAQFIRNALATTIPKLNGIPQINETEIHQALEQINDPTSFSQMMNGGIRNHMLIKHVNNEVEESRRQNLAGYQGRAALTTRKEGWQ